MRHILHAEREMTNANLQRLIRNIPPYLRKYLNYLNPDPIEKTFKPPCVVDHIQTPFYKHDMNTVMPTRRTEMWTRNKSDDHEIPMARFTDRLFLVWLRRL